MFLYAKRYSPIAVIRANNEIEINVLEDNLHVYKIFNYITHPQ